VGFPYKNPCIYQGADIQTLFDFYTQLELSPKALTVQASILKALNTNGFTAEWRKNHFSLPLPNDTLNNLLEKAISPQRLGLRLTLQGIDKAEAVRGVPGVSVREFDVSVILVSRPPRLP
jgi:hypothetical protein